MTGRAPSIWRPTATNAADWFSPEEVERSRTYQRPLTRLRAVRLTIGTAALVVVCATSAVDRLTDGLGVDGWVGQVVVAIAFLQLLSLVYDVPLDAWVDLGHDRRWGMSTQSVRTFVADQLKSTVLGLVLGVAILVPVYALVRATEWWWLFGWLLVVLFSVVLGFLFPVVLAPIFNRFTPLPAGELADRITAVAERAGVTISGVWVADESRRSRRDNAYVAGLGATRRVVLFDTLLEHPPEVVEQVVAHEIGHWRLRHLRRQLPLAGLLALVVFLTLRALAEWESLLDAVGASDAGIGDPAALPLVLIVAQGVAAATGVVAAWVSRAFEREADLEALRLLHRPGELIDMHRRLHVKNLADLDPGWFRRIRSGHPPPAERMAFAQAWADGDAPRGAPPT